MRDWSSETFAPPGDPDACVPYCDLLCGRVATYRELDGGRRFCGPCVHEDNLWSQVWPIGCPEGETCELPAPVPEDGIVGLAALEAHWTQRTLDERLRARAAALDWWIGLLERASKPKRGQQVLWENVAPRRRAKARPKYRTASGLSKSGRITRQVKRHWGYEP